MTSPTVFVRRADPVPTVVFDSYWRFAARRQDIFFRRLRGEAPPWTEDEILKQHRFTNAASRGHPDRLDSPVPTAEAAGDDCRPPERGRESVVGENGGATPAS